MEDWRKRHSQNIHEAKVISAHRRKKGIGNISEGLSLIFWEVKLRRGEVLSDLQYAVTVTLKVVYGFVLFAWLPQRAYNCVPS